MAVAAVSGLIVGGVAVMPSWAASDAKKSRAGSVAAKAAMKVAMKTVVYQGYELRVPASWPVYRLDKDPSTCVRYDIHAVYLGTPGANERCPAGLIGRTQTVSVIPSTVVAAGSGAEVTFQRAQPGLTGGTPVRNVPAVRRAIVRNAARRELRVALGKAALGATVIATYGDSSSAVEQVLASLRSAPRGARATAQSAAAAVPQRAAAPVQPAPPPTTPRWQGVPAGWPTQIVVPPPPPRPRPLQPVSGFDTCTAPSLPTMKTWRRAYGAIGVYIGGVNSACAYGNLSASWIRSAAAMGWGMLPTYVGPQAPCYGYGVMINPKQAAAQGRAAAADAISDAKTFGLGSGTPIYYDMEAYNASPGSSCVSSVLTFLGAWDREMSASGFVPAVYSSQDSGIADMQAAAQAKAPGFTAPQAVWFAMWDGQRTLSDGSLVWPTAERSKQYQGPQNVTLGGTTLNIDSDLVAGPLAR